MWIIICCPLDLENYSDGATFRRDSRQMFELTAAGRQLHGDLIDSRFSYIFYFIYLFKKHLYDSRNQIADDI